MEETKIPLPKIKEYIKEKRNNNINNISNSFEGINTQLQSEVIENTTTELDNSTFQYPTLETQQNPSQILTQKQNEYISENPLSTIHEIKNQKSNFKLDESLMELPNITVDKMNQFLDIFFDNLLVSKFIGSVDSTTNGSSDSSISSNSNQLKLPMGGDSFPIEIPNNINQTEQQQNYQQPQQPQQQQKEKKKKSKNGIKKKKKPTIETNLEINLLRLVNDIYLYISNSGSEEERISSIFKLYDIYDRGHITRCDLKRVVSYRIKQNGLLFSEFTFESLIDHIFEQYDKNNDASILHTVGWIIGMGIASGRPDYIFFACLFPHFTVRPTVWSMIFLSLPGVTGFIMLSFLLVIVIFSFKWVRIKNFELFYYSHHIFILFYALLILHGTLGWINPPTFWKWFIAPSTIYALDRGFRLFKKTHRVSVVDFSLKYENVIYISLTKPTSFQYKPGQYLLINIPKISKLQWHPFTMTSSPLESTIKVHIRVTGGWTKQLSNWLATKQSSNSLYDIEKGYSPIEINIDGPFGSSSQYALKYKHVILLGAGIGITPMASLLQDIKIKKEYLNVTKGGDESPKTFTGSTSSNGNQIDLGVLEKVHFFWLNREISSFQWFEDLLVDITRNDQNPKISINTFNTKCFPKQDARNFMLWNGLEYLFKTQGLDPTTNLPFKTHWGRPNWDSIFEYYSRKYAGEVIGVFCCGPSELSKDLYEKCRHHTSLKPDGTKFYFHKENF
eukprot:gene9903-12146_t